jgi:hypothetical protein
MDITMTNLQKIRLATIESIASADKRQGGLQRVATVDRLTSRKRFGRAAPKGAQAGDNRPVPVDPGRVGTEYPAIFP